jgi:ATP-dependent Zn protease
MGHALIALSLPGVDPVQKVSIIPSARAIPSSAQSKTAS